MAVVYERPDTSGVKVHQVVPDNALGQELTADRMVVVINRSREKKAVKWDGQDHVFMPGANDVAYGIALHAQSKLVAPGSRNVETGAFESFLGIPNIDPPSMCEPFTDDELKKLGEKVEAIDRTGQEAAFVVATTAEVRSKLPGQAAGSRGGRRPQADGNLQATPQAAEAARLAMVPPKGGEAARASSGADEAAV